MATVVYSPTPLVYAACHLGFGTIGIVDLVHLGKTIGQQLVADQVHMFIIGFAIVARTGTLVRGDTHAICVPATHG